ncbi:MAG: division/cell wall cluster transcriptional repressor MraZ [Ignavibacteria bacterium RBG_13_36_8]|nr:MAG: division/cell wall cluster transcriptional repressor MraZ [Ignavibacteria bacterium RBG_13_36_8]
MFVGSFNYSIDAKGRVSIPAKFRKHINLDANKNFMMTRGIVQCIDVYPLEYWQEEVYSRICKLDDFDLVESNFKRHLLQLAAEDHLDSQFRLLIPKNLIEFAGIDRDVIILGQNKKIEIWDPQIYLEHMNQDTTPFSQIAQQVMHSKSK